MFVQQFFLKGIAHSSYLLGGTHACAIVDPRRDVDLYLAAAREMGMRITHILETHLHADFISGHMDLAEKTGAAIYAPKAGGCSFAHVPLAEGDAFAIDDLEVSVRETPGHTPEHLSYVVTDRARGAEPVGVFCGDTLFVGDVGRPDLFPGRARELASKLYASLHQKLLALPDHCEVYPAHGAGSLCGRAMGAKRSSTIGYERRYNGALQIREEEEFIASLTTDMPPAPDHFSRCSATNAAGPTRLSELLVPEPLSPSAFRDRATQTGAVVLDVREYACFGGQHVPGAWNIDVGGNFATFAGWVLPAEAEVLLVGDCPGHIEEATVGLRRVGIDRVAGHLEGGMFEWARAGLPMAHIPQVAAQELQAMMSVGRPMTLVDVRAPGEFAGLAIDGAVNIPAPDLRTRFAELDPSLPTVTICNSGLRSSLAAGILRRNGFPEVVNVAGGMTAYGAVHLNRECPVCVGSHGPRFLG